jgi:hypothetical protein
MTQVILSSLTLRLHFSCHEKVIQNREWEPFSPSFMGDSVCMCETCMYLCCSPKIPGKWNMEKERKEVMRETRPLFPLVPRFPLLFSCRKSCRKWSPSVRNWLWYWFECFWLLVKGGKRHWHWEGLSLCLSDTHRTYTRCSVETGENTFVTLMSYTSIHWLTRIDSFTMFFTFLPHLSLSVYQEETKFSVTFAATLFGDKNSDGLVFFVRQTANSNRPLNCLVVNTFYDASMSGSVLGMVFFAWFIMWYRFHEKLNTTDVFEEFWSVIAHQGYIESIRIPSNLLWSWCIPKISSLLCVHNFVSQDSEVPEELFGSMINDQKQSTVVGEAGSVNICFKEKLQEI